MMSTANAVRVFAATAAAPSRLGSGSSNQTGEVFGNLAAAHGVEFVDVQLANFVVKISHVIPLCLERAIPLMRGGRSDMKSRSFAM
jgi:hypothetical protein